MLDLILLTATWPGPLVQGALAMLALALLWAGT